MIRFLARAANRLPRPLKTLLVKFRGVIWMRQLTRSLDGRKLPARLRPVSVVIPSYNDVPLLKPCIESLNRTLQPGDEILIVDDYCDAQNTKELLALESERVKILLKAERKGFAGAVNVGMARAQHDIILLNSDIVALPGWVEMMQVAASKIGFQGLISPKLVYPDGRIQYGGTFWARTFAPQWFAHRYAGQKFDFPPSNTSTPIWGASGAALYVPREVYSTLGGLDEEYWLGFEDVDYAMQAITNGFASIYEPAAILVHHESATRGKHQGNRELTSMRHFWKKWSHIHTRRSINTHRVHVAMSETASPLLRSFRDAVVRELSSSGLEISSGDSMIGVPADCVTFVLSPDLIEVAWNHHVTKGLVVQLADHRRLENDPEKVAWSLPEVDFIALSSAERDAFQRLTGWPARIVTPSVSIQSKVPSNLVAVIAPQSLNDLARNLAYDGVEVVVVQSEVIDESVLKSALNLNPKVIIGLAHFESALVVAALIASGVPFVGQVDASWQHHLQDGYNCFRVDMVQQAVDERVQDLLQNEASFASIRSNARDTNQRMTHLLRSELLAAISTLSANRSET